MYPKKISNPRLLNASEGELIHKALMNRDGLLNTMFLNVSECKIESAWF